MKKLDADLAAQFQALQTRPELPAGSYTETGTLTAAGQEAQNKRIEAACRARWTNGMKRPLRG